MLREIRDELRDLEAGVFAESVRALAEVAERLQSTSERQEKMRDKGFWTEDEAAIALGYVDDEGQIMKKAFVKMVMERGIPRHKTSHNRAYYFPEEVAEALRKLEG